MRRVPLDKIYRQQRVPFVALVLVVTRVRSLTLPHPSPDLYPISLFGTILHAPPPTSFSYSISCSKYCCKLYIGETGRRLYLTDLLNNFFPKEYVLLCICCFSHLIGLLSVTWLSLRIGSTPTYLYIYIYIYIWPETLWTPHSWNTSSVEAKQFFSFFSHFYFKSMHLSKILFPLWILLVYYT